VPILTIEASTCLLPAFDGLNLARAGIDTLTPTQQLPRQLTALVIVLFSAMCPARADTIPYCPLAQGVEERPFGDGVPSVLRDALADKIGTFARPGEPFDSTDIVMTGQSRRLIFVRVHGTRWVIATEHGGRGYNDPVFAYDVDADGSSAKLVGEQTAMPGTLCATASKLLESRDGTG
jgi:hypothetical protein